MNGLHRPFADCGLKMSQIVPRCATVPDEGRRAIIGQCGWWGNPPVVLGRFARPPSFGSRPARERLESLFANRLSGTLNPLS